MPDEGQSLDIGRFLHEAGTPYLIAESIGKDAPVAPLFACLTTEIHYMAALLGSRAPGGRLDPPLLMALDEVTQICPVPVPSWLADSGGKGIQIITVAHGEAQLRGRWDRDGSRVIMDTSGAKIWLPGISDPETLAAASTLCGTAAVRERGQDQNARHPVMTAERIRQLPAGRALVVRGGHSPVIARLPMCWKDPLYRAARRNRQAPPGSLPSPSGPPHCGPRRCRALGLTTILTTRSRPQAWATVVTIPGMRNLREHGESRRRGPGRHADPDLRTRRTNRRAGCPGE